MPCCGMFAVCVYSTDAALIGGRATATCPYCRMAKSLLTSRGVAYAELPVDASEHARDETKSLGARGLPFILIGGSSIEGFDEEKILELLEER